MGRLTGERVKDLDQSVFVRHSLWCWDDAIEGHCPIVDHDNVLPEEYGDVFVHAKLTTLDKTKFEGYLVGGGSFFCFAIFYEGEEFIFNLNLPDLIEKELIRLRKYSGVKDLTLFPVQYETVFKAIDGTVISGMLDL